MTAATNSRATFHVFLKPSKLNFIWAPSTLSKIERIDGIWEGFIVDKKGAYSRDGEIPDIIVWSYYGFKEDEIIRMRDKILNLRRVIKVRGRY